VASRCMNMSKKVRDTIIDEGLRASAGGCVQQFSGRVVWVA
jgi:hypothetical protein